MKVVVRDSDGGQLTCVDVDFELVMPAEGKIRIPMIADSVNQVFT